MASLSAAAAANAEDEELEDPINDEKEKEHFRQVVESFRLYKYVSISSFISTLDFTFVSC